MVMSETKYVALKDKVIEACSKIIVGKEEEIFLLLVTFVCSGHVLLEDVPGTGKTMLLRGFSKLIGGEFKRVQFTPDLLPSDLTGIHYYNQKESEFEFRPGPLFSNVVLADEINRATPRTQSSLLEAMEEAQITVDGTTFELERPFMVMATQNPLDSHGTFPLPDAQMDRFFMRLSLGYMSREQEGAVLSRPDTTDLIKELSPIITADEINDVQSAFKSVSVHEDVLNYILDIVTTTRTSNDILMGVSTRGAKALYRAAQACALLNGRDFVLPEDVKLIAPYVLSHRIQLRSAFGAKDAFNTVLSILNTLPVPVEDL